MLNDFKKFIMKGNVLDFSFSGLKTAVLRWVESHDMAVEIAARKDLLRRTPVPSNEEWLAVNTILDETTVRDIIPRLKQAGGEGIVEYPLNKIVF